MKNESNNINSLCQTLQFIVCECKGEVERKKKEEEARMQRD
jgi:hypothetical protein